MNTGPPLRTRSNRLGFLIPVIGLVGGRAAGLVRAVAISVAMAMLAGVPAEDYSAGDRFALFGLLVLTKLVASDPLPGRLDFVQRRYGRVVAKQQGPTAEDRATAIRVALSGVAEDLEVGELAARLAPLHPKNNTFPGEVLLELAADAIEESGATRERPLKF